MTEISPPPKKRAVFLDRDGTINVDPGYLAHPSQLVLLPDVGKALHLIKNLGFELIVVSNQSGVGRGLIDPAQIPLIHKRMNELLAPDGVQLHEFELCYHKPEDQCDCRKPSPRLLKNAAKRLNLDLAASYMIGDKVSDIEAGKNAGCLASILVRTGEGTKSEANLKPGEASFVAGSLLQAAQWIQSQET